MCHIVHSKPSSNAGNSTAYAEAALSRLYGMVRERGLVPSCCEAWICGGGNMFPDLVRHAHVGLDNATWARERLAADRVKVLSVDVGGSAYRRLGWTVGPDAPDIAVVPVEETCDAGEGLRGR